MAARLLFALIMLASSPAAHAEETSGSPLSRMRQLILSGTRSGEGYFSRDGKQMIFQTERDPGNPFFQIVLLDMATGETRRLSTGKGRTSCAWLHPDGTRALFSATHEDPNWKTVQDEELERRKAGRPKRHRWVYDEYYDIYEVDFATGKLTNLTRQRGYDAEASYSPDGKHILFASNRRGYGVGPKLTAQEKADFDKDPSTIMDLYIMDADGSNVRRITQEHGQDGGPFYSFQGDRIVWRHFLTDRPIAEIWVADADGSNPRQVTRLNAMSWAPYFHPSDDYIIFSTNLHGFANFELYLVDAEGKRDPVRATELDGFDGLPAFSPDGEQLAWTSNRTANEQGQIFIGRWDDARARQLLGLDGTAAGATEPVLDPTAAQITAADIRSHVATLAAPEMAGRKTGTEGERKATEYAAARLKAMGFEPAGENGSWYQPFEFVSDVRAGSANVLQVDGDLVPLDSAWRPVAFSANGTGADGVVFAGYGIVSPDRGPHKGMDSYGELNVKDRFVAVFRFLPEGSDQDTREMLAPFSSLRRKAMAARQRGARGLVVISGPNSKVNEQLVPLRFDGPLGESMLVISVDDALGARLLGLTADEMAALQTECDASLCQGFPTESSLAVTVDLKVVKGTGRNVLARLPVSGAKGPPVVVGAHIDHIGDGEGMGSLAKAEEKGAVHPGADDNASGVAVVLEVAEALAQEVGDGSLKPRRELLVGLWSGEEMGLLGSAHYAGGLASSGGAAAYVNLDMVGRLRDQFIVYGLASSPDFPKLVERANFKAGLPLVAQQETYLPTDATSFYTNGVPILSMFTGVHEEYNTPRDTPETLDYEGARDIGTFTLTVVRNLLVAEQPPVYQKVAPPKTKRAGHGGRRVYLGTVPDFAAMDVVGVRLSDTSPGGPAHEAGVRGGDVVVELAGQKVENLEEYAYALQLLKVGEETTIVVIRDGERVTFKITPASRD